MEYINNETLDILSIDNVEGVNIDSLDLQSIDSKIAGYQSIVEKRILGININYEIEDIFKNDTELYTEVLQVIKKNNKILEKYCNRDMHKNKSLVKKLLSNNQITFIGGKESVTILQLLHLTFETLHSEDKKFNKRRIIFGYNYFMNKNRQKLEETYNILFQNEEKEVGSTLSKDLDERINLLLIERDVDFYEMEKNLLEDIIKRLSLFVDKSYVYFYATLFALKSDNVCKSVDYNEQLTLSFLNSILIKAKIYFLINCFKQELFSASQNFISEH